jgi:N-acetylglutamate synthase-like GNAT family acetyltransferase
MKIRKATTKDIPQMLYIIRLNSPKYPQDIAKKELKEMFSRSLFKPTYIVVEDKKEILAFGGFIRSWADSMIFNIFWVNTNPKNKGLGIGSKLIKELINEFSQLKEKRSVFSYKLAFYEEYKKLEKAIRRLKRNNEALPILLFLCKEKN